MKTVLLGIKGMHCHGCAMVIQSVVEGKKGVLRAAASRDKGEARVMYDPQLIDVEQIIRAIEQASYHVISQAEA